ncbi:MAG: hypothetical protein Q7W55_08440 [Pseudohongiella sp.]|nr:hypothetical protein [Pseudohongiella sp.]
MINARPLSILSAAFVLLMSALPASAQTTVAAILADIPQGTYRLTFTADPGAPDNNPRSTGDVVNFILAENGRLCTNDLSLTGATLRTAPDLALEWRNDLANSRFYFRVTDSDPDPDVENYTFQNIQFLNTAAQLFGVFTLAAPGDYSATTGSCGASTDPTSAQIETFFTSAETAYPALFPAGSFTFTQRSGIYTFRYYDSTSTYLAVSGGQVYARGGQYSSEYRSVGSFQNLSTTISNITRPASVGVFFVGTYRTEMSDTQPFSTIPDGAEYIYAINASGQLCMSNGRTLSKPVFLSNDTNTAVWYDDVAGVNYRLDLTTTDAAEGLLQVYGSTNLRLGELAGDRTSLDAICQIVTPAHPDTQIMDQIERLFELAEQLYPEYITFGPTVSTQRTADYTYRYYPVTNVFIAVSNGMVYAGNGTPNFSEPALGTLNQVFIMLRESTRDFVPAATLVGTYDVLVSGANPFFQLPNNTRIRLVIAASGALCIDNITLNNPTSLRASPSDISWTNIQAGINAYMTLSDEAGTAAITLISTRGENLATLAGQRVSQAATCPLPQMSALEIDTINELLLLAERRYPDLLSTRAGSTTRATGGALSRYYPETGVTVSVSLNEVFVRGGEFGSGDYFVGTVGNLIGELRASPTDQPAVIPSPLPGTYSMIVSGANPFAPFSNNSEVRMVISSAGDLCLNNEFSTNPRSSFSSSSVAHWSNTQSGFEAYLDLSQPSAGPLVLALSSSTGNSLGSLTGSRISGETVCSAAAPDPATVLQSTNFFALAERRYGEYFPTSISNSTRNAAGALVRHYPATGISITVVGGRAYFRGGDFGALDFYAGTVVSLSNQWQSELGPADSTTPYSIRVTGTTSVLIAGMTTVNRQINITKTEAYSSAQLSDSALLPLATSLLSGEIQGPDSSNIFNIVRNGSSVSFSVQLSKTTVVGSSTTRRNISANFVLQAQ